jgi:hypothetical protein
MKRLKISIFLIIFVSAHPGHSQKFQQNYFASPLQIALDVTGAFAEIRANHFHSGADFKTQKKEGLPILAVADGFISRIKVSPVGFGNALYIDHPNGQTSVYGHMLKYNTVIATYVNKQQYDKQSFAVDLFPAREMDTMWVKKGDLIGFSGNSGTSFGAHLHFEIRTTSTERILNPFLAGFKDNDFYYPYFDFLKVYPIDENSSIRSSGEPIKFPVKNTGTGSYRLQGNDTLFLWGQFAFGVQAFDYTYSHEDRNGFYGIRMTLDNNLFFNMQCDSFAFDESRNINACIDYQAYMQTGQRIVWSRKLPGNNMSFFNTGDGDGTVMLTDGALHVLLIEVYDYKGNTSKLEVPVMSRKPEKLVSVSGFTNADTTCHITWNKATSLEYKGLRLNFPPGALYDDIELTINKSVPVSGLYSARYVIHNKETPLQKRMTVSLDALKVPSALVDKALIVSINPDNGRRSSEGGVYITGRVSAETNEFGTFAIAVDTVKPAIKLIPQKAASAKSVKFSVSDNLAGIADYYGELNGKWVLVEWDPKNRLMFYRYDKYLQPGGNTFKLVVKDAVGNIATYNTSISKK